MSDPCKQEIRIADLEAQTASQNTSIGHLGDRLKELVSELKWHNRLILGAFITYVIMKILGGE